MGFFPRLYQNIIVNVPFERTGHNLLNKGSSVIPHLYKR